MRLSPDQCEIVQERITVALHRLKSFTRKAIDPPQVGYSGRVLGQIRAMYLRAATEAARDLLALLGDLQP